MAEILFFFVAFFVLLPLVSYVDDKLAFYRAGE